MAGKRSHFIPRFLQKGFSSRMDGNRVFIWFFPKNSAPKELSTKDVGLENKFSSSGRNTAADDQITMEEEEFSRLVNDLKNGIKSSLSDPLLPRLIAIFELRTRHFRQRCLLQSDLAITRYKNWIFRDGDDFKKIREKYWPEYLLWLKENQPHFWEYLQQFNQKEQIEIESKIIDEIRSQSPELVEEACSRVKDQMSHWTKLMHLGMLEQSSAESPRAACFEKLTYAVLPTGKPLILGDSIVLFCVEGHSYKPFLGEEDVLNAVYLPLTPEKVLVGVRPNFNGVSTDIQKAIARCSLEFFLGANNSEESRQLQREIGTDAIRHAQMEIEATLDKMQSSI